MASVFDFIGQPESSVFDMYAKILMDGFIPEQMIVCDEDGQGLVGKKGTWFLSKGNPPQLMGEAEDFDRIWQEVLLGRAVPSERIEVLPNQVN